jgi:hypothetical protein
VFRVRKPPIRSTPPDFETADERGCGVGKGNPDLVKRPTPARVDELEDSSQRNTPPAIVRTEVAFGAESGVGGQAKSLFMTSPPQY